MSRLVRRTAASLATLAAAFGATAALAAPANAGNSAQTSLENQVSALINKQRAGHGCGALTTDAGLRSAARAHSADMATHNLFSHNSSTGAPFSTRIVEVGFTRGYAENIAWGQRTAASVVDAWMNSAPHRANILTCSYNRGGVGVAYKSDGSPYWTQDFGRS